MYASAYYVLQSTLAVAELQGVVSARHIHQCYYQFRQVRVLSVLLPLTLSLLSIPLSRLPLYTLRCPPGWAFGVLGVAPALGHASHWSYPRVRWCYHLGLCVGCPTFGSVSRSVLCTGFQLWRGTSAYLQELCFSILSHRVNSLFPTLEQLLDSTMLCLLLVT